MSEEYGLSEIAAQVHKLDAATKEVEVAVRAVETTAGRPRFLGVPSDEQLIESSSSEGILCGRKISEVYAQDTAELAAAGLEWSQAIPVLRSIQLAIAWQNEMMDAAFEAAREKILQGKHFFDVPKEVSKQYEDACEEIQRSLSVLPGFASKLTARSTGARVQFDNPISNTKEIGDGNYLDIIASEAPEREVTFTDDAGSFVTIVNMPTLYVAEAYHLLEKGNAYAMTGEQLARLVKAFDQAEFDRVTSEWLAKQQSQLTFGLQMTRGHEEQITYEDDAKIEFTFCRSALDVILNVKPFTRAMIYLTTDAISSISLSGEDYHYGQTLVVKDGRYFLSISAKKFNTPDTLVEITASHPLQEIIKICDDLYQTAKTSNDGLLEKNSQAVHRLKLLVDAVVNPNIEGQR